MDKKDRLVAELASVAFANLGDFLTWGPDGLAVRPLDELSPAQCGALAAVTITRTAHGGSVRLAMHDKLSALHKLCKMFGLYEKAGAPADGEAPAALSDVERAQRLAAILRLSDQTAAADGGTAIEVYRG